MLESRIHGFTQKDLNFHTIEICVSSAPSKLDNHVYFFFKKKRIEKVTPQQQATRVWVNSLVLEEEGHSGFGYWYEAGEHDTWRCEGVGQAPPGPRLPG